MPMYQYVCEDCQSDFRLLVNRGDDIECPKCQSKKLDKQPSMPALAVAKDAFPSSCGDPSLPPCGAPMCRRTG